MKVNTINVCGPQAQAMQYLVDLGLHNNNSALVRLAVHSIYYQETSRLPWNPPASMPNFKHVDKGIAKKIWNDPLKEFQKSINMTVNLPVIMWKWLTKMAEDAQTTRSEYVSNHLQGFLKSELMMAEDMIAFSKKIPASPPKRHVKIQQLDMRKIRPRRSSD
jgi:hypothetical protein